MSEALAQVVAVVDRLRSPGGCPWDRAQTHESLVKYLLEEAYETVEAIETNDLTHLREELGDLLLQVVLHARLAEEAPAAQRFSIDDVADDLVAKMIRRHPHVFGESNAGEPNAGGTSTGSSSEASSAEESHELTIEGLNANWDYLKSQEKQRNSVVDGVPIGQPALALAAKLVSRANRAGLSAESDGSDDSDDSVGERLFALVVEAVGAGIDPEAALRRTARAYRDAVKAAEASTPVGPGLIAEPVETISEVTGLPASSFGTPITTEDVRSLEDD